MTTRLSALAAVLALIAVPCAAQAPLTLGKVFPIESRTLNEERKVVVWTPPGYAASGRAYPVLYLTDAEAQFGHTVTTVEFLSRNGRMPGAIVVGIFNVARTRDLTPYKPNDPEADRQVPTAGGADRFLQFIETELVPWVEREYRTEPLRMFAGHSFGGLFGVHALATRPDLFNVVIAVSPTLHWRQNEPVKRLASMVKGRRDLKRTLYVTLGAEGPHMQSGFDALRRALKAAGSPALRWHLVKMDNEDHGSIVLRSHYDGLEKVFDGWRLPRTGGVLDGGLSAVIAHYAAVSERIGWRASPPEATINNIGYAALAAGRTAEALEYFQFNARTYPASANVYDSLGEAFEAAGRLDEALAQYEKAVRQAQASKDPLLDAFVAHRDAARTKLAGSKK